MSRLVALAAPLVVACSFSPGRLTGDAGVVIDEDAPDAEIIVPDASDCVAASAECIGDTLRTCSAAGATPTDRVCEWGCNAMDADCYELAPSGGWETPSSGDTTDFQGLADVSVANNAVIDTDAGTITGVADTMFDYEERPIGVSGKNVGVFRFNSLTLASVSVQGTNALALVADDGITITGVVDAVPACAYADVYTPGPGGYPGGDAQNVPGQPLPPNGGGGAGGGGNDGGGGGGGHGAEGGDGGNIADSGGNVRGDAPITNLLGGSGGGAGDDHSNSGRGGGGGAAIHLIANGPIRITGGGINAGGCGGRAGTNTNDGGGGGGAGGAILIEGVTVEIGGTLAANGGGGGGGNTGAQTVGQKGQLSRTPATGGPAGGGSAGGAGGAGATPTGTVGTTGSGGGGGGGIGRIRVTTRSGAVTRVNAVLSPGPGDPSTTYSEAVVQRR